MSGSVPQEPNRFGFIPNVDPISAFCQATALHDPDRYARWDGNGTEATPGALLVGMLWHAFDASSHVVVRHGDEVMHLCLYSEVAVYGDTIHLGPLTIDVTSSSLRIMESGTSHSDFVLDGVPLRLTHPGNIVDATYCFAQELTEQVLRMWKGEVSSIVVTHGDRQRSFGRDDIRLYHRGSTDFAVRFGSLLMVRPDRGAIWSFRDGISDGIDLDGVPVRIEVVPVAGHEAGTSYPGPFDPPRVEPVERIVRSSSAPSVMAVPAKRGPDVRGTALAGRSIDTDDWSGPVRSQAPRRGLGRPGVAQAA